jgi:hypothetical protein
MPKPPKTLGLHAVFHLTRQAALIALAFFPFPEKVLGIRPFMHVIAN